MLLDFINDFSNKCTTTLMDIQSIQKETRFNELSDQEKIDILLAKVKSIDTSYVEAIENIPNGFTIRERNEKVELCKEISDLFINTVKRIYGIVNSYIREE